MPEPLWTEQCSLEQVGDLLRGHNGGWLDEANGGARVDGYLFRFVRDDGWVKPIEVPPQREPHEVAHARLAGNTTFLNLRPEDRGHVFTLEVYAVTFSGAFGNEPAWAEWGFHNAKNREQRQVNTSAPLQVWEPPPPPPTIADVAKAITHLDNAIAAFNRATAVKRVRAENPHRFPTTNVGIGLSELDQALYALRPPR